MENARKNLLLEISRCDEFKKAKTDISSPCYTIVGSQKALGITDFQLPEPWNGHLDTAEILFISSNPSIDPNENYPTASWNDEDITSFFDNRFDGIEKFNGKTQKFWYNINKWTVWVVNAIEKSEKYNNRTCNLLKDYACSTEIVHCKSPSEIGVTPYCEKTCFNNWLRKILKIFTGKYIIVVGSPAEEFIKHHLDEEFLINKKIAYTHAPTPSKKSKGLTDEVRKQQILAQLSLI